MTGPRHPGLIDGQCRACGKRHDKRWMCDPLLALLNAQMDAAESLDIPVSEFAKIKPMADRAGMLGPNTVTLRQLLIKGATTQLTVAGGRLMTLPALIITGLDADDRELPQWVYAGSPTELRKARDLCDRMTEMAIRRAGG